MKWMSIAWRLCLVETSFVSATAPISPHVGLELSLEQREYVKKEVISRTVAEHRELCKSQKNLTLEVILNDALYQELERLRGEKSTRANQKQYRFWEKISHEFHRVTDSEREKILSQIVEMYVDEIMGYFNPVLHGLAAKIIPWGLKAMLSRFSPKAFLKSLGSKLNLEENLSITGPVESIRSLSNQATLIMAPSHVSNLDSVVIGLALYLSKLAPFTYGAGLNLFSNPIISFFMNNLGAYKVDRRKKNSIYKSALKQYATMSMELGQHNLFFPGGTRSRSGEIEQHIKLGLLGCGLNVYVSNLKNQKQNPDVFIIPCTISYGLVLEAQTLIDDHLKEKGKSRYIRIRNDLNRPMRILNFWRNLQSMESRIHLHFGEPLDLFGNHVNAKGQSLDSYGRLIDRKKYVTTSGMPEVNAQRDQEYTRELGRSILKNFQDTNVIMSTNVLAFIVFELIAKKYLEYDLYRLIRFEGPDFTLSKENVLDSLTTLLNDLKALKNSGKILLNPDLLGENPNLIFDKAVEHFHSFHNGRVVGINSQGIYPLNMKLLYYYRNRLDHYGLKIKSHGE